VSPTALQSRQADESIEVFVAGYTFLGVSFKAIPPVNELKFETKAQ
jgi:hypothetical protein